MNTATRQILQVSEEAQEKIHSNADCRTTTTAGEGAVRGHSSERVGQKPRVFVAAGNRPLRETLSRVLVKSKEMLSVDVLPYRNRRPFADAAFPCLAKPSTKHPFLQKK